MYKKLDEDEKQRFVMEDEDFCSHLNRIDTEMTSLEI